MKNLAKLFGMSSDKPEANKFDDKQSMQEVPDDIHDIQQINIDDIVPNPFQPRKTFHEEALDELAASIAEYGVIQPILVRRLNQGGFELIAGERRLRASKRAGLKEVPIIVKDFTDKEVAELAMIENLQREDLHFLEEAEGYYQLLVNFGLTQEELAKRVGKNQSTIANKLRILKLSPEVRSVLISENLTERHARSLLKLNDTQKQMQVLDIVRQKGLNVRETEGLIEEVLEDISREMSKKKKPKQNFVKMIRDVRIFVNSINSLVKDMQKAGIGVNMNQEQDDDYIMINMKIPKKR